MKSCLVLFSLSLVIGCASVLGLKMGKSTIEVDKAVVVSNYDKLRSIVVEEASNSGFSNLTEVKPSQYNDWQGRLNFRTDADVFTAEILKEGNKYSLYMHGGAMSADIDGAIKAITQRVTELSKAAAGAK